jgi:hypothetical protein
VITLESIVQYATLGTLITGFISLVVWARIYQRQVNAQIVIELSTRYASLFQSFPVKLWVAHLNSDQSLPEQCEEFAAAALQYAAIVVFAYHLHDRKYLTDAVWALFQAEHQRTAASPWFVREWNVVKREFGMYSNFIGHMERLLPKHG